MMNRNGWCTLGLLVSLSASGIDAQGVKHLISGDANDAGRLNFVFLAEAYTAAQEQTFLGDLDDAVHGIFQQQPYREYADYFNVWGIFVASAQSGADHPLQGVYRDTYFNSTFGTSVERLVTVGNTSAVYSMLSRHVPDYDIVCVLVNDDQYGGSGGAIAVATTNSAAVELILHEAGHSYANLADEYDYAYSITPSEQINVTARTTYDAIRWNPWIDRSTPLPTPKTSQYGSTVGLFEGAMYQPTGWYRPKLDCKMRNLNVSFCEVCREGHVAAFYKSVSPLIGAQPDRDSVLLSDEDRPLFSVQTRLSRPNTIQVVWLLDGEEVGQGETLDPSTLAFEQPHHTLTAIVTDASPLVRIDEYRERLQDEVSWTVSYQAPSSVKAHQSLRGAAMTTRIFGNRLEISGVRFVPAARLRVELADATGRRVGFGSGDADFSGGFNLSLPVTAAAGVYFIRIADGAGTSVIPVVKGIR